MKFNSSIRRNKVVALFLGVVFGALVAQAAVFAGDVLVDNGTGYPVGYWEAKARQDAKNRMCAELRAAANRAAQISFSDFMRVWLTMQWQGCSMIALPLLGFYGTHRRLRRLAQLSRR